MARLIMAPGLLPAGPIALLCALEQRSAILDLIRFGRGSADPIRLVDRPEGAPGEALLAVDGSSLQLLDHTIYWPEGMQRLVMPLPITAGAWLEIGFAYMHTGLEKTAAEMKRLCREALDQDKHLYLDAPSGMLREITDGHRLEIGLVRNGLADAKSRETLDMIANLDHENLVDRCLSRLFRATQYFEGLRFDDPDAVVVNIGVHTGWDLPFWALLHDGGQGTFHHVDPLGIDHLTDYNRSFLADGREKPHKFYTVAVGSYTGTMNLAVSDDGQAIGASNYIPWKEMPSRDFPCISLSDLAVEIGDLDVLKIDSEGAEQAILWGGLPVLRKYRPQIAVAIYHSVVDLWGIPLWVMRHLPDYKLFIRTYMYTGVETILYAIPKEIDPAEALNE